MGLEKILYFISKNCSFIIIEEIQFNNNDSKKLADNIFFDFNFIIYNNLAILEKEINSIIKLIYCIEHMNKSILLNKLNNILNKKYWLEFKDDIIEIFNKKISIPNIVTNFTNYIEKIIYFNKFKKKFKRLYYIIFLKIYYYIINKLNQLHYIEFIKNIHLFFDGIPEYSKILEQKRRRAKTYYDSKLKKELFNNIFTNIDRNIIIENDMTYNYFDWLDNKYNIDKSFGPSSDIIIELQHFLKYIASNKLFDLKNFNIKIKICGGNIYGESDFKIFRYIYLKKIKGVIYIHTCDTDLLHLILIQQCYAEINNLDINYNIIRYYSKKNNNAQIMNSTKILNNFIKIIKKNNMINPYNVILDILFLCYFFGNDYLPENNYFNTKFTFDDIIYILKKSYKNGNMIYYNNKDIHINWTVFINVLENLKLSNNKYKILKSKYNFSNDIYLYINENNITTNELLYSLIPLYMSYLGSLNEYKENDWRNYFYNKYKNSINPFKNNIEKSINNSLKFTINNDIQENTIDYIKTNLSYFNLSNENSYQDMYYFILHKINNIGQYNYNLYYKNYIDETKYNSEEYLVILYSFLKKNFINMSYYKPFNILYYSCYIAPPIDDIILYLKYTKNISIKFDKIINDSTINKNNYFKKDLHHYFITPVINTNNSEQNEFKNKTINDYKNIDPQWILNNNKKLLE
jgi:hypothetical protein